MSVADAVARVSELERLLAGGSAFGPAAAPPPPSSPAGDGFAARLAAVDAPASSAGVGPGAAAGPSGAAVPFAAEIDAAATRHGLDPALLRALIRKESGFHPGAVSPAGARGLTQLMPGTAAALRVDPSVPAEAIEGGARYLREQLDRFGGDPVKALAAYNAGPGAVQRHGGVPPYAETQDYVRTVMAYAAEYRGTAATDGPGAPVAGGPAAASAPLPYSTV